MFRNILISPLPESWMLTQVTQKNLTDTSDHSAVTLLYISSHPLGRYHYLQTCPCVILHLSEVYEECLVLGKVDPRELVLPLSVSENIIQIKNICTWFNKGILPERVPADHLKSLHVAEVLVKCCVPVHRELTKNIFKQHKNILSRYLHQLAAILDPSFVIVTVRLLQTLGLASVPAEWWINARGGDISLVPPCQRGLVPHRGQPPLQVEPAAAVVEAVPDLVAEHEAEAAVREAARHPGHGVRVGQRGEQRQGQHHAGQGFYNRVCSEHSSEQFNFHFWQKSLGNGHQAKRDLFHPKSHICICIFWWSWLIHEGRVATNRRIAV